MARVGVEAKPTWRQVPAAVRERTESALSARVTRASRAWGGYSPTPTFRLLLADGRRAFFKAASPESTAFARVAHVREERVYEELHDRIGGWSPRRIASFAVDDWRVLLLEDVGPRSTPPWTPGLARRVAQGLGQFHASTAGDRFPDWIPRPDAHPALGIRPAAWSFAPDDLAQLAGLANHREREAEAWLDAHLPALREAAATIADPAFARALLHVDVRSDNLRWANGRLYLFDWPHVGVGPPEFDAAAFAQTVPIEGGPSEEQVMAWYAEAWPVDPAALDAAVASIAGYFANHAWAPELPELPRVRTFQRQQLAVTLRWAARRLGLPDPDWVAAVPGVRSAGR
jgi:hypothetical protein